MTLRERLSLDGQWQFWTDPGDLLSPAALPDDQARAMAVPAAWQAQAPDLRFYTGTAWYRRKLEIPANWFEQSIFLGFGAVDYRAEVWLNDAFLGSHEGGYLPFTFDVTAAAHPGVNELVVRVVDPARLFPEIPHGKQSWYGLLSGIWQPVWLERRATLHVAAWQVRPDASSGQVHAAVTLTGPAGDRHVLRLRITNLEGALAAEDELPLLHGENRGEVTLDVVAPRTWSPDHPDLYTWQVELVDSDKVMDTVTQPFGFRTIEARDGRLWLNGELLYLRGALDQDYYPGSVYTVPSTDFLEDEMRKAKDMGLNCLRCHIKVADPRYYETADRLGLLIWTELPNWKLLTARAAEEGRATMEGLVERDAHHPSIIAWTIINEGWGVDLVNDPTHRNWLRDMYRWLKQLDPTRLAIDNSPCVPNFHMVSDLDDFHYYKAIPDHRREWDRFVAMFATRAAWTFSPYGDATRTGSEPLVVSEFGNWGLPDFEQLLEAEGQEPWWFETGSEWDQGIVYPHGIRERFQMWRLDKVFGDWKTFITATQWQEYLALKYEIETMRLRPEICGYIITELTDVHWECNGLLDMQRNPKVFYGAMPALNADTVVIPGSRYAAYWAGRQVQVDVAVAHGAGAAITESEVCWQLVGSDQGGRLALPNLSAGQTQALDPILLAAPEISAPVQQRLAFELAAGERILASSYLDLAVYPQRRGPANPAATLWTPDPDLADWLQALGYVLAAGPRSAQAVVYDEMDEAMLAYVREGGRLLLLAGWDGALPTAFAGLKVGPREDTLWAGDWASSFAWLRRSGPFAYLPGGPLLDHSFDRSIPEYVIHGFQPWEFETDVHAGVFIGWIHRPVATIGERRYGLGRAVLTTFRLIHGLPGSDPTATTLLDALIELTLRD